MALTAPPKTEELSSAPRVVVVVVTHNRSAMLRECLEALAAQTHPVAEVVLVDNASTDGTLERLVASGLGARLDLRVLRVSRNGGGAEGFHYGVRFALQSASDWLWLMDDDCEPEPATLAVLLASPRAAQPSTSVLMPLVRSVRGDLLPLHRGQIRRRWFMAPMVALREDEFSRPEVRVALGTFVGH